MMPRVAISTISISPHLMSMWRRFAQLVDGAVYYYHTDVHDRVRAIFGWDNEASVRTELVRTENRQDLEKVPALIETMRDLDLIQRRLRKGLLTVYSSERWFKPPMGFLRLLNPGYFIRVWRFMRFFSSPKFLYLAQGIHAARDMARLVGLFRGNPLCLFRAPKLEFERIPGGRIVGYDKIRIWGYFVEPSDTVQPRIRQFHSPLRILWVGRMVDWKRTITIIEAVKRLENVELTVVGEGREENRLKTAANGFANICFRGFVKADQVRELMREHDVYILSSDGEEGWGATLNEAMEEGMCVFGTYEAGASATILPEDRLYHAGDVDGLVCLLQGKMELADIGEWRVDRAAKRLVSFLTELEREDAK